MSGTSDCLLKRKKKNTVSDEQHVHLLWGEILQIIVATPRVPSIYHSLGSFGAIDPSVNKNKTACVCRVSSSHTWHRNHVPALTLCHIFVIHCRIRSVACFPIWNQLQHSTCFILFQRHPAAVVQLQGDGDPAGHGGSGLGCSSGRCTNLWHLPQDQIRRWLWEPVFLLPDKVLCSLWGASVPAIQHGKRSFSDDALLWFVFCENHCDAGWFKLTFFLPKQHTSKMYWSQIAFYCVKHMVMDQRHLAVRYQITI